MADGFSGGRKERAAATAGYNLLLVIPYRSLKRVMLSMIGVAPAQRWISGQAPRLPRKQLAAANEVPRSCGVRRGKTDCRKKRHSLRYMSMMRTSASDEGSKSTVFRAKIRKFAPRIYLAPQLL